MVRRFPLPDPLGDELESVASEAFRNPRVLQVVEKELHDRLAHLNDEANRYARTALVDESRKALALRTEGRMLEIQDIIKKINTWKQ